MKEETKLHIIEMSMIMFFILFCISCCTALVFVEVKNRPEIKYVEKSYDCELK